MGAGSRRRKRRFCPEFRAFDASLRRIPNCARGCRLECFDVRETRRVVRQNHRFASALGRSTTRASWSMVAVEKSVVSSPAGKLPRIPDLHPRSPRPPDSKTSAIDDFADGVRDENPLSSLPSRTRFPRPVADAHSWRGAVAPSMASAGRRLLRRRSARAGSGPGRPPSAEVLAFAGGAGRPPRRHADAARPTPLRAADPRRRGGRYSDFADFGRSRAFTGFRRLAAGWRGVVTAAFSLTSTPVEEFDRHEQR